jgi:hypothetical protein
MRIVGLCLVAALAAMAVAATSALAEPSGEFGTCVKQTGGKYENSGCTKEAKEVLKQKYEWHSLAAPVSFSGHLKAETVALLETVKGTKITCKKATEAGEIANAHELGNVVATFEECVTGGIPCQSAGQASGTIVTVALSGGTGVEKKGTTPPINNKLAEELHPTAGGDFVQFECAGLPSLAAGSVLHPAPTGKMVTKATEKFAQAKGEQKPSHYEGEAEDSHALVAEIGGGFPEEAGTAITAEVTFAKAVELNPIL